MPKGQKDPHRRQRIVEAASQLLASTGVEGLTHRAVAAAANVPLGSTTYHFASLNDLLFAIVDNTKQAWNEHLDAWAAELGPDPDIAVSLSDLLVFVTGPERDRSIIEYELYVAALRRPALRALSLDWDRALDATLARYVDPLTAEALALAADGITLRSLIRGEPLAKDEVEPLMRRIIGGNEFRAE
ncbi:TetR/AcrR family transcriptional regulator [Rhodococcus wratislaviensis]|uniref:TetR/AcrR family transcriptional regulator n=1 Tax=Rhodococcus wratislaviensis TaxID=44752 RepID=UPI00365171E5